MAKRKKAKRLTPIQKIRNELAEVRRHEADVIERVKRFGDILEQCKMLLWGKQDYGARDHGFGDIPLEIMRLADYRIHTEGSVRPEREHSAQLLNIIRWQINKEAARDVLVDRGIDGMDRFVSIDKYPGRPR